MCVQPMVDYIDFTITLGVVWFVAVLTIDRGKYQAAQRLTPPHVATIRITAS